MCDLKKYFIIFKQCASCRLRRLRARLHSGFLRGRAVDVDRAYDDGAPEHEARTFETGGTHGCWDLLPEIETKVIVVSGKVDEERSPAGIAASVAERLPNGSYIELRSGNHLTPFITPDVIADLLRDALA